MDAIFKALADPSRRALLDALREEDGQTQSELEARVEMTRFGVAKHLGVLEAAGLVTRVRRGRFVHHYLNAAPLAEAFVPWIAPYAAPAAALLNLKARLENPMDHPTDPKPDFVLSTYIRCTQDALWDALTDADAVPNYDFLGQTAERRGDALVYHAPDGSETLVCTEIEATPKSRLVTTFEPRWEDAAPSRVIYLIEVEGDYCRLTVEHHGLTHPAEGGTADGWARTLAGLKTWLETGQPAQFGGPELWSTS